MTAFVYRGRDTRGHAATGTVSGRDATAALSALRDRGLTVTALREARPCLSLRRPGGAVALRDLRLFAQQFATMVEAGLPVLRCLTVLQEQTSSCRLALATADVRAAVEAGTTLSAAMLKHPRVFSRLFCSMVAAGEAGGLLDATLRRVARQLEQEDRIARAVKGAMAYPVLVGLFALAVLFGMVMFLVPVFADMYRQLGDAQLPLLTRAMMRVSALLRSWPGSVAAFAGVIAAHWFAGLRRRPRWAPHWDRLKLRLPLGIGVLVRKIVLARASRTLGALLSSGAPLLVALEITGQAAGNAIVEREMQSVQEAVKRGEGLTAPLRHSRVFPAMVVQMVAVGEETGSLDTMLARIADFYEDEADAGIKSLTALIEPVLMLFVGAVVGAVVVAMYLPIFTMMTLVK
jgi:type IV pilus assembly protein PilC